MALLDNPAGNLVDGRKTVTTGGTAVQLLAASTPCTSVAVTALSTNTGIVVVGASTVVAAAGTRRGVALTAGQTASLDINDVSKLWIDATVNGEGVSFAYLVA